MATVVIVGFSAGLIPSYAQQAPTVTEAAIYKELLGEANDRVARTSVALAAANAEVAKLREELKAKEAPKVDLPKK